MSASGSHRAITSEPNCGLWRDFGTVRMSTSISTVSGILTRSGLGKLSRLEPIEPPNRYEHARPGDLIHIDVKKLGRIKNGAGHRVTGNKGPGQRARGAGWEYVHVCIDDHSRLAYVEVLDTLIDLDARTVQAELQHFSTYALATD